MTYKEKLRDPRWQKRRLEIMQRDGFKCQCCGDSTEPLNVHHLQYYADPWSASDSELETLCEHCHNARSSDEKAIRRMPTSAFRDFISKAVSAARGRPRD